MPLFLRHRGRTTSADGAPAGGVRAAVCGGLAEEVFRTVADLEAARAMFDAADGVSDPGMVDEAVHRMLAGEARLRRLFRLARSVAGAGGHAC